MYDATVKYVASYTVKLRAKYWNFEQNIEHNRSREKESPERKIGDNESKTVTYPYLVVHTV